MSSTPPPPEILEVPSTPSRFIRTRNADSENTSSNTPFGTPTGTPKSLVLRMIFHPPPKSEELSLIVQTVVMVLYLFRVSLQTPIGRGQNKSLERRCSTDISSMLRSSSYR